MNIEYRSPVTLRQPGLGDHWPGHERYVVRANAMVVVPLLVGDLVNLVDPEGLQSADIVAFDDSSEVSTGSLGLPTNAKGDLLATMLNGHSAGAYKIQNKLSGFNIDLANAGVARVLEGETPAGSSITFQAEKEVIVIIGAPGKPMEVDQQNPPTDLIAWITRASPQTEVCHPLPDPLADTVQEFRIAAGTAQSYEVKSGQYIQIIDVDGRQCSDFQCFDTAKLDKGIERCLDATVTRTLMASAYPGPGLHSKFYDVDLTPVVEVIQDTCGRHDSFGLACSSKYYDDLGYPGHVNCSDNFNHAIADYPVAPRGGWMAMNLFFNTFFDDDYQLYSDEPWSRPGDYVLMQASRDLVCLSSSCPDDIDAANGWNPTDIHVRVYDRKELFKRAIAFRKTTDAEPVMTQETGFHPETSKLTRNFVEYNGYWLANCYTNQGAIEEYWACRQAAVMIDLTPLRKYEVHGPDAEQLMQYCVPRDMKKLAVGQVVYTAMCNQSGGMIDDGTIFRMGKDNFRWIGGCDGSGLWLREQAEKLGLRVWVKNATDQLANLQIQGPESRQILNQIVWTRPDQASVEELNWFRFSVARMQDDTGLPIVVSRTGYTGELGYEVFCHPTHAPEVWRMIAEAGAKYGIKPMGLEALDMLRIEAGLIFAGYEFCEQTDPFEAGIPFSVPLKSKTDDFIGRDALEKRKVSPQRKLVGLELTGKEPAAHGDGVFDGRYQVGEITSAVVSPVLGKNIALCKMNIEYTELNTEIEVGKLDGQQKRLPAKVVAFPHFDPNKERVRGNYEQS
ncbi:MAG: aminomethyltransferase family protein [Acidiferrobacterales bacterium]|nr:aminomethyltransferase family protein [Acidiferrobacterales bacterium]